MNISKQLLTEDGKNWNKEEQRKSRDLKQMNNGEVNCHEVRFMSNITLGP